MPLLTGLNAQRALGQQQAAQRNERNGYRKGRKHDGYKLAVCNVIVRVQIQILRVAKGRKHAAQVCRNVLQDKHHRHIALAIRYGEYKVAQRQKGDQRHIVGNEHGTDKGDVQNYLIDLSK